MRATCKHQLEESLRQLAQPRPLESSAYGRLLQQCAEEGAIAQGRRVFAHARATGANLGTYVWNQYLEMLARCGRSEEARRELERMPQRDTVSWNILLGALAPAGESLELFRTMDLEGVRPDRVTFLALLRSCSSTAKDDRDLFYLARAMESRIAHSGLHGDAFLSTTLLSLYGKCGRVDEARRVFDAVSGADVVASDAMILAYAQSGHLHGTFAIFRGMHLEGQRPTKSTFLSILDAVSSCRSFAHAREARSRAVESGFSREVIVATSMVNAFGKCGSLADARMVFEGMSRDSIDEVCWNSIIEASCECGDSAQAFELFRQMDLQGFSPNESTFVSVLGACSKDPSFGAARVKMIHKDTGVKSAAVRSALVSTYAKCGQLHEARKLFDEESEGRDSVSWSTMVMAHVHHGDTREALRFFHKMDLEGLRADAVTILGAIAACSNLSQGMLLHQRAKNFSPTVDKQTAAALIAMYGRCGSVELARAVFDGASGGVVLWTAMIAVYADAEGCGRRALELYHRMNAEGLRANAVTLARSLDACWDVKLGRSIHARAAAEGYGDAHKVKVAALGMFTRCGSLREARVCFDELGAGDLVAWSALLGAYTCHGCAPEAIQLFARMPVEGLCVDGVVFVSVLSACGHAGRIEQCREWFVAMVMDFDVEANVEHYACLVDALGRAGRLEDAHELMASMPFEAPHSLRVSLLGACKTHGDASISRRIARGDMAAEYVLLSSALAEEREIQI